MKQQPEPVATAVLEEPVAVGRPISSAVVLPAVPDNPNWVYATVNKHRVIVDPQSHKVAQIVE